MGADFNLREMTQEQLAEIVGIGYSATNLSQKLGRGSLTYNEFIDIAEILGYDIQLVKQA